MQDYKVIEVKRSIFEDNDADAARLRDELKEQKTFLLNLMSSPGAGKTTTLRQTISRLILILMLTQQPSQRQVQEPSRSIPVVCVIWTQT